MAELTTATGRIELLADQCWMWCEHTNTRVVRLTAEDAVFIRGSILARPDLKFGDLNPTQRGYIAGLSSCART